MDFLNKAFAQVTDLLRGMTVTARFTTGLLLAVVLISLVFLFRFERETEDDYLFGAEVLSQREIDAMMAAFGQAGLNGFRVENQRIRVPRAQRPAYYAALADAQALPEHPGTAWAELFSNNSALDTRDVRELKAQRVIEREVENVLRKMTGIYDAIVRIEEKDVDQLPRRKEKRALASVRAHGTRQLDEDLVRSIREAVAAGGGIDVFNVTVLDLNAGKTYPGKGPQGKAVGDELPYLQAQRQHEQMYRDKIAQLLDYIPGVTVDVDVLLTTSLSTRTTTQKYDAQPVAIRTSEYEKDSRSISSQVQGRPGAASNGVGNTAQAVAETSANPENASTESRNNTENLAGVTHAVIEDAGLIPKSVRAAVSVPRSYLDKVWREENPDAPAATPPDRVALQAIETREIQNIEAIVTAVLPEPPPGVDKFPRITVRTFTDLPLPTPTGPSVAETATSWFSANWQTLGMFLLAGVAVLMLRNMLRAASTGDGPLEPSVAGRLPLESLAAVPEPDEEDVADDNDQANSLRARFQHSGRSLRDELSELIKEDPDAAANVLQNWIGDAA